MKIKRLISDMYALDQYTLTKISIFLFPKFVLLTYERWNQKRRTCPIRES